MEKIRNIEILVALALFPVTKLSADHSHDYATAAKAYNQGDYQTAFHLWGEEASDLLQEIAD